MERWRDILSIDPNSEMDLIDGKVDRIAIRDKMIKIREEVRNGDKFKGCDMKKDEAWLMLEHAVRFYEKGYIEEQRYINIRKAGENKKHNYKNNFRRGHIYRVFFDTKTTGAELRGEHYAVVLTDENFRNTDNVIVVPITSANKDRNKIEQERQNNAETELGLFMIPLRSTGTLYGYINVRQVTTVSYARIQLNENNKPEDYGAITIPCMRELLDMVSRYMKIEMPSNLRIAKAAADYFKTVKHKKLVEAREKLVESGLEGETIDSVLALLDEGINCDTVEAYNELIASKKQHLY